jgi:Tfp pilus assembly protein PilN
VIDGMTGPFICQTIIPFLPATIETLVAGNSIIKIKAGLIEDISVEPGNSSDKEYQIGDDAISSRNLLAYSAALTFLLNDPGIVKTDSPSIKYQNEEFRGKNLFRLSGYSIIGMLLIVLLTNFFFYNYYKNENGRLSSEAASYQNILQEVTVLENKIKEKEGFMKRAGWLSSPKTSFYADDIAATIPSSIKLNSLKVNPVNTKNSRKERKQVFMSDTLLVSGSCVNATALNPWMNELKSKKWVQSLSHLNYSYDHKTSTGNFEIEIRVNHEF